MFRVWVVLKPHVVLSQPGNANRFACVLVCVCVRVCGTRWNLACVWESGGSDATSVAAASAAALRRGRREEEVGKGRRSEKEQALRRKRRRMYLYLISVNNPPPPLCDPPPVCPPPRPLFTSGSRLPRRCILTLVNDGILT